MSVKAVLAEKGQLDWLGVLCSLGCAIHCAAMPVLAATLPSLVAVDWLRDPLFHQAVALFCGYLALKSILPGYREHHDGRVLSFATAGLTLLFAAAFVLPDSCCDQFFTAQRPANYFDGSLSPENSERSVGAGQLHASVPAQATEQATFQAPRIVLVSSNGHLPTSPAELTVRASDAQPSDATAACIHQCNTIGFQLFNSNQLESQLGAPTARTLLTAQPFLSPLGGLFLIIAHILNIRLRCCLKTRCSQ